MKRAETIFDALLTSLGVVVGLIIAFFALSMSLDWAFKVTGRGPIPWLRDVIEYLIFAGVFLGTPWALRQHAHVRVDLILSVLPPRGKRILEYLLNLLGAAVCLALGWFGYELAVQLFLDGSVARKTITMHRWVLQAVIAFSMLLCVIEFAFRMIRPTSEPHETPHGV